MKKLFTIGFTKKSAEDFFTLLYRKHVRRLLDVRYNPYSQLAGFARSADLKFFLETFYGIPYEHSTMFTPSQFLLEKYRDKKIVWEQYVEIFNDLMDDRGAVEHIRNLDFDIDRCCLLCAEESARFCHRRLVAELIRDNLDDIEVIHLGDPLWNERLSF